MISTIAERGGNDPLEAIVAEYLRSRGLSKTLAEMCGELKELNGLAPDFTGVSEAQASQRIGIMYARSYCRFKSWTASAIGIFKDELELLSFPVFVMW